DDHNTSIYSVNMEVKTIHPAPQLLLRCRTPSQLESRRELSRWKERYAYGGGGPEAPDLSVVEPQFRRLREENDRLAQENLWLRAVAAPALKPRVCT
ncbi:unnamed protein product, partial [Nesidiocoris tenuis]